MDSVNCVHGLGGAESLLQELRRLGVALSIDDDDGRLTYDAPAPLGDELLSRLRANREALLVAVEQFEERAAIVEYGAKLSRDDAERIALAEMVGEPVPLLDPVRPMAKAEPVEAVVEQSGYWPVMSGVLCPWCRAREFLRAVNDEALWCDNCDQLAFRFEGNAIVSADWVKQSEIAEGMPLKTWGPIVSDDT